MDSTKQIMERLGFNKEADDSTKAAFIKNLIKQAYGVDVAVPAQYAPAPATSKGAERGTSEFSGFGSMARSNENKQLSFDFGGLMDEPSAGGDATSTASAASGPLQAAISAGPKSA